MDDTAVAAPPHVRVARDGLEIDGRPTFLYGGEIQYFRVRDPAFDGARTAAMWADRLEKLKAAGGNFVSTYIPWDYHEPAPGRLDFKGARDLGRFLEMAAEKGFYLCVKPGPNILAEWPFGFTSWGAIPLWWKRRHPAELVRDAAGRTFRWHPLFPSIGPGYNTLPSYASEPFRAATARWYEAVLGEVRRFLGPGKPIVAIQLDNEVNLFWTDLYRIDFNPAALARFRARLRERYGTIEALADAYGRRYRSFEEVRPPRKRSGGAAAHRDWLEHQHALCGEWIGACRAIWRRLGVNEPEVIFLTNDTHQTFPGRDLVLPNGPLKNRHALHAIDTYPRCLPIPRRRGVIYDRPYESDVTNKLVDGYNDLYAGPSRFTMGIEVQGGQFPLPFLGRVFKPHEVPPASTLQTYLRLVAHGMKALAIYVLCDGLNLDGTRYDYQAAMGMDGSLHPRHEGLRAVGRLIREHERALLESDAVESRVALVADAQALGTGYGAAGEQRIYGDELRATFGWLANAGFTPRVLDLNLATDSDLAAQAALIFPTSGRFGPEAAHKLERYVARGGMLIQAIRPGPLARSLFPAERVPLAPPLLSLGRAGTATFFVSGAGGTLDLPLGDAPRFRLPPGAEPVLFVAGEEPFALGYGRRIGSWGGRAVFLGRLPASVFAGASYYTAPAAALEARAFFLRRLLREAGEERLFAFDAVREECHGRRVRSSGDLLLFVFSSHVAGTSVLRLRALDALGLDEGRRYVVEEIFGGGGPRPLGRETGAELRDEGIRLALGDCGSTVLRVTPA